MKPWNVSGMGLNSHRRGSILRFSSQTGNFLVARTFTVVLIHSIVISESSSGNLGPLAQVQPKDRLAARTNRKVVRAVSCPRTA